MKLLVTGASGFIGYHTSQRLLDEGHDVVGMDNMNAYYDVNLKKDRLALLRKNDQFTFYQHDLEDRDAVRTLFEKEKPQRIIHLAAQAGVRYSLDNPEAYAHSNVVGFLHILEGCRHHDVEHLVYASTSSIYGLNRRYPFSENDPVDHPVSLYAATKKANEVMAHSYSYLFNIPTTGLRFFTVYGPWGRPDMALFKFTKNIVEGKPIDVYNHGNMERDFTFIDDIVEGILRVMNGVAQPDPDWSPENPTPPSSSAPYRIYNIGANDSVKLMDFVQEIEKNVGKQAIINMLPMQPGDVKKSHADVSSLVKTFDYTPRYNVEYGVKQFVDWYKEYYKVG